MLNCKREQAFVRNLGTLPGLHTTLQDRTSTTGFDEITRKDRGIHFPPLAFISRQLSASSFYTQGYRRIQAPINWALLSRRRCGRTSTVAYDRFSASGSRSIESTTHKRRLGCLNRSQSEIRRPSRADRYAPQYHLHRLAPLLRAYILLAQPAHVVDERPRHARESAPPWLAGIGR